MTGRKLQRKQMQENAVAATSTSQAAGATWKRGLQSSMAGTEERNQILSRNRLSSETQNWPHREVLL